ncbi:MAG TPA: HRDC domain-containing protein [Candidatus Polarisedimenticolaceae bacterium]|nr:HRDC domain-containing protein [Candidatus Polarisedimenticolaceae bacterium]
MAEFTWIETTESLAAWLDGGGPGPLAIDTEADSFHHYREKVCLVQLSAAGRHALVDPFAELAWDALARRLADPAQEKILHGADYDVRLLERDLGLTVVHLFDTSIAARLIGETAIGLAALLAKHLGVTLDKSQQRADWSKRPLSPAMRAYAVADTAHLEALAAILAAEAERLGRLAWVREECRRIETVRWRDRARDDPDAFRRVKGAAGLARPALAILRELWGWRDAAGRRRDRPVFRILRDEVLVAVVRAAPATIGDLVKVAGFPEALARSPVAAEIVDAVRRGAACPEADQPELRPGVRIVVPPDVEAKIDEFRQARDRVAKSLALEPSVVANRAVLEEMARRVIAGSDPFEAPDLRLWQATLLKPAMA